MNTSIPGNNTNTNILNSHNNKISRHLSAILGKVKHRYNAAIVSLFLSSTMFSGCGSQEPKDFSSAKKEAIKKINEKIENNNEKIENLQEEILNLQKENKKLQQKKQSREHPNSTKN